MKILIQSHLQAKIDVKQTERQKQKQPDKQTDRQTHGQPGSRRIQPTNLRASYLVSVRRQRAMQPATRPARKPVSHATASQPAGGSHVERASEPGIQPVSQSGSRPAASQAVLLLEHCCRQPLLIEALNHESVSWLSCVHDAR